MSDGSSAWYYAINGQKLGPVSESQLKELALGGKLTNALVWKDGMPEWTPSNKIKGLVFPTAGSFAPTLPTFPAMDTKPKSLITKWCVFILLGSVIWISSAFMPWWGLTFSPINLTVSGKSEYETIKKSAEIIKDNIEWYDANIKDSLSAKLMKASSNNIDSKLSINIWGISTGTGLLTLIISIIAIVAIGLSFFIKLLAHWRWSFASFLIMTCLLSSVFDLLWLLGSPSESAPPLLKQWVSFGPYFHIVGTFTILTGSIFESVFGYLNFSRK